MKRPAGPTPADAAVLTVADCLIHMHASITSGVALCPVVITCRDRPFLKFQGVFLFLPCKIRRMTEKQKLRVVLDSEVLFNHVFCKS